VKEETMEQSKLSNPNLKQGSFFSNLWNSTFPKLQMPTTTQTPRFKIVMQNEEILLQILTNLLNVQKDSLATVVALEKIHGDLAVSLRDMSDALQEIAFKFPDTNGEDLN